MRANGPKAYTAPKVAEWQLVMLKMPQAPRDGAESQKPNPPKKLGMAKATLNAEADELSLALRALREPMRRGFALFSGA